ncbi:glucose-6-phosphate dehydrogenase [Amycolatopsis lurida]
MTESAEPQALFAPSEKMVPHVFVIFGATGDLARRKLFPGLFRLMRSGLLPEQFRIIGSGRNSPGTDEEFRYKLAKAVFKFSGSARFDDHVWEEFAQRITFQTSSKDDGEALAAAVDAAMAELGPDTRKLLYLSVPPDSMEPMVKMLGATGLAEDARVVLEKPFGRDLESSRSLNTALHQVFAEEQLFRIDHFLGKEAVQNILALRFANGFFEPVWNRHHISYVQIDVPESIGIEGRAGFMESTGTFRDMISTHLFQLLGFLALEPPVHVDAESLRVEKRKLFQAVRALDPDRVVFGQYEGYRDEPGVADESEVETFVAAEVWVDNWRWKGVPFLLRTGKAMEQSRRTITLGFVEPPLKMFDSANGFDSQPNELVFELTEDSTVTLELRAKRPGPALKLDHAKLHMRFSEAFADAEPLEAYERLLLDVLRDDQTLFTSAEEVERLWELCDPVLRQPPKVHSYEQGSWGPAQATELAGERGWRVPEKS